MTANTLKYNTKWVELYSCICLFHWFLRANSFLDELTGVRATITKCPTSPRSALCFVLLCILPCQPTWTTVSVVLSLTSTKCGWVAGCSQPAAGRHSSRPSGPTTMLRAGTMTGFWFCEGSNFTISHRKAWQGVYRFNWTNFQEISRIFQEGFLKKSRTCLHCFGPICNVPNELYLAYGTHHTTWGHIRDRIGGPVSSRSNLAPSVMTEYQCGRSLHKNFRSLHKNFQEDHLNSRRFPGFPGGFSNSKRFPGFPGGFSNSRRFPGVVDTLRDRR